MNYICTRNMVVVAQLVRVSVCGTEGRGFESRLPPKSKKLLFFREAFFVRQKINYSITLFVFIGELLKLPSFHCSP